MVLCVIRVVSSNKDILNQIIPKTLNYFFNEIDSRHSLGALLVLAPAGR